MSKTIRKFLVMLLVLTVTMAFSGMSAFAYTAVDDDGARANAQDGTLHVVTTNSGMMRISDEGTTVTLSDDFKTVNVKATTANSATWGKTTKLALIEATATDNEKEEASKLVVFDDPTYSATAVQKVFHYSIPVEEIGKKVPVCAFKEDKWTTYNGQSYFIVVPTPALYDELTAALEKTSDEEVKANLNTAIKTIEDSAIELTVGKEEGVMMSVDNAKAFLYDDAGIVRLTLGSDSYSKVYVGYAGDALLHEEDAIAINEDTVVDIPVARYDEQLVYAFLGTKWYNRGITVSKENKTLTFSPVSIKLDMFDDMTTEEAIARASVDTSVEIVNKLIEAIQVQVRDENTDKYCAIAHAYYNALSAKDKKKLDDPGYFGDDTGDASLDDPLNQDNIGKNELLVVSFGTSFNESRYTDIGGIEKALQAACPDWSVRRAFTAQIIINHIQARDEEKIDNMDQALQRAIDNGVKNLVIQPTHLMHGAEYDELVEALDKVRDQFDFVEVAEPLLGEVGADATTINTDKETAAKAMVAEAAKKAGADSVDALEADGTAIVFMGHGTAHNAAITYSQMQAQMTELGYKNVFVGTVEGNPAETALPEVKKAVEAAGYTKVILRPMMVVAGDHANNDMAADEEGSWYYGFVNGGEFEVEGADAPVNIGAGFGAENVTCQIEGLGRIPAIQNMYVAHTKEVLPPAEPIKVYLTVSDTGMLAKANDDSLMTAREVVVEDLDNSRTFTFDEALVAAHKAYNTEDGYSCPTGMVKSLWGVPDSGYLFFINDEGLPNGVTMDTVSDGDELVAAILTDTTAWSDWYTFFEPKNTEFATEMGTLTLTLKGHLGMAYEEADKVNVPLKGMTVKTSDGTVLGTTDENGQVECTFDETGDYTLTAEGTVESVVTDWSLMALGNNTPPYGTMDFTTLESQVAYTESDYGDGPYPKDEIKYIDFYEEAADDSENDYAWQDLHYLKSNQVISKCPIIAPYSKVSVFSYEADKEAAEKEAAAAKEAQEKAEKEAAAAKEAQEKAEQAAAAAAEAQKKAEEAQKAAEEKQKAAEEAQKKAEAAQKAAEDQAAADKAAKEAADKAAAEAKTAQEAAEKAATEAKTAQDDADTKLAEAIAAKEAAEKAAEEAKAEAEKAKIAQKKAEAKNYTVKGLKVTSKGRKFTVKYKKNKNATGYQIKYKLKTDKKYKTLKTLKKIKFTSKKLKKGKVYQFKVRTYTLVNGKKVYGKWTAVKTVKCK